MTWFFILIFLFCCVLLYFSGELVVRGLMRMARFLGWSEFVVAFFVMAFAASLPNLLVGINSAIRRVPELSFGDVSGNNLVAMTLAVALAVFFSKDGKDLCGDSRTIQKTSVFTMIAAILPILLILDNNLSRIDGVILISFFVFYVYWLFSKKERFTKIYQDHKDYSVKDFNVFLKDLFKLFLGILFLIISSFGIVGSAKFFAQEFNLSLIFIGIIITGLGNALPEVYFAIVSAKKGENWMILGDLMGAVIIPSTLVLGLVALIHPIEISDFSSLAIARFFLMISALFFFVFVRTDCKITKKEGFFLLLLYIAFLISAIIFK